MTRCALIPPPGVGRCPSFSARCARAWGLMSLSVSCSGKAVWRLSAEVWCKGCFVRVACGTHPAHSRAYCSLCVNTMCPAVPEIPVYMHPAVPLLSKIFSISERSAIEYVFSVCLDTRIYFFQKEWTQHHTGRKEYKNCVCRTGCTTVVPAGQISDKPRPQDHRRRMKLQHRSRR